MNSTEVNQHPPQSSARWGPILFNVNSIATGRAEISPAAKLTTLPSQNIFPILLREGMRYVEIFAMWVRNMASQSRGTKDDDLLI